ncbi:MAG TPA: endolytic transglycosylase MltG [Candidatus Saccharimonadales bacterium]|nr:endolytic transglycosylase MltG [Candidatus Saccharimonadales bacterium]
MKAYKVPHRSSSRLPRRIWWLLVGLIVLLIIGAGVSWHRYDNELQPVSNSQQTQIFTVNSGDSVKVIADHLQAAHLIRSAWAMELYVHSKQLSQSLQAGTYALSPSDGTRAIIATLTKGKVATRLVTILPGRRIDQVRADLINDGFSPNSVDTALNPKQYVDLPVLAFKPAKVKTLEGLLWPDSFEKDAGTDPSVIIRESLTEMGEKLTPDVQSAFAKEGLSTYKGLILTSIVEQEVNQPADQAKVAQVFLSRLKEGSTLGSDVTAMYGSIMAGQTPNLQYDSPYNTLIHPGLPPTPISSISLSALTAATNPAHTHWLYFVTGDNGTTYFSTNLQDQQANAAKYCHKLCSE